MTILKNSINGFNIFIKKIVLFLFVSLAFAAIYFYGIPYFINSNVNEEIINQELGVIGYGAEMFSTDQIMTSMIASMQTVVTSTILLIVAYIVKYIIDKRLFSIKRWRDWRFFIYISGTTFLETYIIGNIFVSLSNSFIGSTLLMIIYSFVTVVVSAILLPEEN